MMKKTRTIFMCCTALLLLLTSCDNTTDVTGSSNTATTTTETGPSFEVNGNLTVEVEKTAQINVTNLVGLVASDFKYESYNTDIATVNNTGLVTGIEEGQTQILISAKSLRKTVNITVTDSNKLNGLVSYRKLKRIVGFNGDDSSYDYTGAPIMNIAWDQGTYEATEKKFDFADLASDDTLILRGAHVEDTASIDNGDYVIVMSNGGDSSLISENTTNDVQTMVYAKVEVSQYANQFRLWGWSTKSDLEASPASGYGKFRIMAYEFDEDYTSYTSNYLKATDIGTLTQDENGWITFDEVSDVANGTIAGAPADNMFVFQVENDNYNIKGKEIILSIETANYPNTVGADGTNVANRFGIKRMGFGCDPKPDFNITSETELSLYSNQTSQIDVSGVGLATEGNFYYDSSDDNVATVSETGLITAQVVDENKDATITITNDKADGISKTVLVHVLPIPDEYFEVVENINLKVGDSYQIVPTNVNGDKTFVYSSGSEYIASVDQEGNVKALNVGQVEITVTFGALVKKVVVNINETNQLKGIDNETLKQVASFGTTGGFPAAWDFAWSGGVTADKIDSTNSNLSSPLIRFSKTSSGSDSQVNVLPNDIQVISGIGGVRDNDVVSQVYVKTNIAETAGTFRLWTYAGDPTADPNIGDSLLTRVVVYIPNENYTSYEAYVLKLTDAVGGSGDNARTINTVSNDNVTGIVGVHDTWADGFLVFAVPEELKGLTNALVVIESYSVNNEKQTRQQIRRFGFDA